MRKTRHKELTFDEIKAIREVRYGTSKQKAYRKYILTSRDIDNLNDDAIKMRAQRFFDRPNIKEALTMSEEEFSKLGLNEAVENKNYDILNKAISSLSSLDERNEDSMTAEEAFFNSFKFSKERPDEIILTGTARFILQRAVTEINARAKEIRNKGYDALHRDASAFTNMNLNAIKIGVSILENRTERYLNAYQNNNTMALELLNRSIQNIEINPEDYTAPIPTTAMDLKDDK